MSKSPEDDIASKANEQGKTSASQSLGETGGGQGQVEEKERGNKRGGGGDKRETQHTKGTITQCPQIIKATWEQYKAIKSFHKTIENRMGVPFSINF